MIGYLDIETSFEETLTVFGLLRVDRALVQIVAPAITPAAVRDALDGVDTVCTFNGDRFDLPEIRRALGLDLIVERRSLDLSVECARLGIRGGLKAIEQSLGISRTVRGINGYDAMVLWRRWEAGERPALETLLAYNRDDVANLVLLERRLHGDLCALPDLRHVIVGPEGHVAYGGYGGGTRSADPPS